MASTLLALAYIVVPGFIIQEMMERMQPVRREHWNFYLLRVVFWGSLSYAFCELCTAIIEQIGYTPSDFAAVLLPVIKTFVVPPFIALLALLFMRWGGMRRVLRFLRFRGILSPVPTAWDHEFHRRTVGYGAWIVVTLTDGRRIAGAFGRHSYAGEYQDGHDIFIQQSFTMGGDGSLKPVCDNDGVWIKGDQIALVEFLKVKEERKND